MPLNAKESQIVREAPKATDRYINRRWGRILWLTVLGIRHRSYERMNCLEKAGRRKRKTDRQGSGERIVPKGTQAEGTEMIGTSNIGQIGSKWNVH
jgi:hypothetical protein